MQNMKLHNHLIITKWLREVTQQQNYNDPLDLLIAYEDMFLFLGVQ